MWERMLGARRHPSRSGMEHDRDCCQMNMNRSGSTRQSAFTAKLPELEFELMNKCKTNVQQDS